MKIIDYYTKTNYSFVFCQLKNCTENTRFKVKRKLTKKGLSITLDRLEPGEPGYKTAKGKKEVFKTIYPEDIDESD